MSTSLSFARSSESVLLFVALLTLSLTGDALAAPGDSFTLIAGIPQTLTPESLAAAQMAETQGKVAEDKKTPTFCQKGVRLVAITGPDNDMLSYRIGGLRNPTLVLVEGATIRLLFVNTDDDMFHNLRFGRTQTVYPIVTTS